MTNIVDRIPSMTDQELLVLFENASARLSENKTPDAAATAMAAIEREWQNRLDHPRTNTHRYEAPPVGMLGTLGYHVGSTNGAATAVRRRLLKHVLEGQLPLVDSPAYTDEWGPANSTKRYSKLIQFLQSQIANPANRDKARAMIEWNEDLDWVQHNYSHLSR
jgi:hypothetical protein